MRNATEATVTTPAPPARDQNKMLPPDHGPTTWLLLKQVVESVSFLRESILWTTGCVPKDERLADALVFRGKRRK